MDRSVTPINEASSGIVKFPSSSNAARIFPDVFPDAFPDIFPELVAESCIAFLGRGGVDQLGLGHEGADPIDLCTLGHRAPHAIDSLIQALQGHGARNDGLSSRWFFVKPRDVHQVTLVVIQVGKDVLVVSVDI